MHTFQQSVILLMIIVQAVLINHVVAKHVRDIDSIHYTYTLYNRVFATAEPSESSTSVRTKQYIH